MKKHLWEFIEWSILQGMRPEQKSIPNHTLSHVKYMSSILGNIRYFTTVILQWRNLQTVIINKLAHNMIWNTIFNTRWHWLLECWCIKWFFLQYIMYIFVNCHQHCCPVPCSLQNSHVDYKTMKDLLTLND